MAILGSWSEILLRLTLGAAFVPIIAGFFSMVIASARDAFAPSRPPYHQDLLQRLLTLATSGLGFLAVAGMVWVWSVQGLLTWPALAIGLILLAYVATPINRPRWLPVGWTPAFFSGRIFW